MCTLKEEHIEVNCFPNNCRVRPHYLDLGLTLMNAFDEYPPPPPPPKKSRPKKTEKPEALSVVDLADLYLQEHGDKVKYANGYLYEYDDIYTQFREKDFSFHILGWLRDNYREQAKHRTAMEILRHVQTSCEFKIDTPPPFYISKRSANTRGLMVFQNGILDLNGENKLEAFTPDFFCLGRLPFAYNPDAKSPIFDKILERVQPDPKAQQMLLEWFGYSMTWDTSFHKSLWMQGEGHNGKSTILCALKALIGRELSSFIAINNMSDERSFALTELVGKTANIYDDQDYFEKSQSGVYKRLVSGDTMQIEGKGIPHYTLHPRAKHTMACNKLPHFHDSTDGFWRRLIILPFTETITLEEKFKDIDTTDESYWTGSGELPGIANRAIMAFTELKKRGRFEVPNTCEIELEKLRENCDTIKMFLKNYVIEAGNKPFSRSDMRTEYKCFLHEFGYKGRKLTSLHTEIVKKFYNGENRDTRLNGVRVYKDLAKIAE